jgi:cobalt-zinc-cadmium efflux system protein
VRAVHDLHVWNISSGQVALSAHVDVEDLANWPVLLESARRMLLVRFRIIPDFPLALTPPRTPG